MRRKDDGIYYHIGEIPMGESLTEGATFGPIRRVQNELCIQPVGLASGEFGPRGLITSITSSDFPPLLQHKT